jgi:hypothetical protein
MSNRELREIDANVRQSLTRGTEDLWKRIREVRFLIYRIFKLTSQTLIHSPL